MKVGLVAALGGFATLLLAGMFVAATVIVTLMSVGRAARSSRVSPVYKSACGEFSGSYLATSVEYTGRSG